MDNGPERCDRLQPDLMGALEYEWDGRVDPA